MNQKQKDTIREELEQCFCKSYSDDDHKIQDCACGFDIDEQENDDPEISEKDFENMYISQAVNKTDAMERRFKIWLENRDDDFKLDIWDFRCLQEFIQSEIDQAYQDGFKQGAKDKVEEIEESVMFNITSNKNGEYINLGTLLSIIKR